jgi:hypothetical protein
MSLRTIVTSRGANWAGWSSLIRNSFRNLVTLLKVRVQANNLLQLNLECRVWNSNLIDTAYMLSEAGRPARRDFHSFGTA